MKKTSKIFALILVIVLCFSMTFTASAASHLNNETKVSFSVTCTKPGYEFTVYQVGTLSSTSSTPYETKYTSLVPEINSSVLSGNTSAMLAALDGVETMPASATVVGTYNSTSAGLKTFSDLDQGIYYVRATNFPAGVRSVQNSVFALPYYDGNDWQYTINAIELATKVVDGDVVTEKTITNSTKNNENYTDVSLGDTVDFDITSTTAGSSAMKLNSYVIYDEMSAGLTLDKTSFNVALLAEDGTKITDLDASEYTVTYTSEGEGQATVFNVALTPAYLQTEEFYGATVAQTSITYSASLNEYAVVGVEGNPNSEIKLAYTNKNDVLAEVEGNDVYVYTYAVRTNKVDENGAALAGAEFALYKTEEDATRQENAIATGVSDAAGLVKYVNADGDEMRLQSGTYYIVETKAPTGYALYGHVIEITVDATYGDNFMNDTWVLSCTTDGIASVDVKNSKYVLPATGGTGRAIFYGVSIAALVGAGIFFVVFFAKKNKSGDAE